MIIKNSADQHYVATKFGAIQQKLLSKKSDAESKFALLLLNAKIWFRRERCHYQINSRWCFYDFFIPALDLFIEIDGLEHQSLSQKKIDDVKDSQIRNRGHKIIRFTNDEVLAMETLDLDEIFKRVQSTAKRHQIRFLRKYKEHRAKCVANAYSQQIQLFGEIINTPHVFLYDNDVHTIFKFNRLFDINVATSIPMTKLVKMLTKEYNRKTRRFILSTNENDIQDKVRTIFKQEDIRKIECANIW